MENPFNQWWLSIEWVLHLIEFEKDFINFLLDVQADYRIQRAMWEDEWDKLLTWTRTIDDIISRLSRLEEARSAYFEKKKQEEKEKIEREIREKTK